MRQRTFTLTLILLPALLLLSGCVRQEEGAGGAPEEAEGGVATSPYTDISVEELQRMMASDNFTLVNVHIPFEGDIPGTDVSIPFDEVAQHLDRLPPDRNAPIVLYCRSDRMSREAATTLAGLGFTHLYNLDGGFQAWRAAGYDLEMDQGG